MMNELRLKGKAVVDGVEVPNIEGGFGEGKKSMLAKDIAAFHGKKLIHVNEAINNNIDKFREGIDFIDVKGHNLVIDLVDNNVLSKMQVSKSKNIYLLSERGYAKLIKIFNDDLSWELYDKLLDEYFDMREQLKEEVVSRIDGKEFALETAKMILPMMEDMGIDTHSKAATLKYIYKEGGVDIPLQIPSPTEDKFISITEIAKRAGVYSNNDNPHSQATSSVLKKLDIDDDLITVTSGSNGNYNYSQTQYSEVVVDMVRDWLDAEGYPRQIITDNVNFNVVYK